MSFSLSSTINTFGVVAASLMITILGQIPWGLLPKLIAANDDLNPKGICFCVGTIFTKHFLTVLVAQINGNRQSINTG